MDAHATATTESERGDAGGGAVADGKRVVVATHGFCLDGLCSAAMFTRLLRHIEGGSLSPTPPAVTAPARTASIPRCSPAT